MNQNTGEFMPDFRQPAFKRIEKLAAKP